MRSAVEEALGLSSGELKHMKNELLEIIQECNNNSTKRDNNNDNSDAESQSHSSVVSDENETEISDGATNSKMRKGKFSEKEKNIIMTTLRRFMKVKFIL